MPDESSALAASVGYHTTIRQEQQTVEVLNLFGQRGKSMKDLRRLIMQLCFRELAIVSGDQWERSMLWLSVLVPTGWRDGYADGAALQSSYGRIGGGPAMGGSVRGDGSSPVMRDLEPPQQPERESHAVVVGRGLAKVRGGANTHHGKDLATSALGRRLLSEDVLRMDDVPQ